jgi:hypothetical protein
MTKSDESRTRRRARSTGVALAAVLVIAGCSAGQVAETAEIKPPISGLDTQTPDGGLLIRNLQVLYNTPAGYPADGTAPLQVSLFNETEQAMTVGIRSAPRPGCVSARQVGLTGGPAAASPSANPEPSGSRPASDPNPSASEVIDPSGPATAPPTPGASVLPSTTAEPAPPARITIPRLSSATFLPDTDGKLLASGLSEQLTPGKALCLVFDVSTGAQSLAVLAPMAVPLSPVSRAPGSPPNKNISEE